MAIHSSVIWSPNQTESIYKNIQTSTNLFPSAWGSSYICIWTTETQGHKQTFWRWSLLKSKHPGGYCAYFKWDTLAGLARLSDKNVTNLLSLAEGFTEQQLPSAVYNDSIFGVSAICDIYY